MSRSLPPTCSRRPSSARSRCAIDHQVRDVRGAHPAALVTNELIEFHRRPAAGGVGMTTVAYCAVQPGGAPNAVSCGCDPRWCRAFASSPTRSMPRVRRRRRRSGTPVPSRTRSRTGCRAGAVDVVQPAEHEEDPRRDLRRHRADHAGARRRREIRDRGRLRPVGIHFGHNYFASSFLSPKLNKRKDNYGGSLENRARIVRETARPSRGRRRPHRCARQTQHGRRCARRVLGWTRRSRWRSGSRPDGSLDALELTMGSSLLNPMYLFKGDAPVRDFANAMPQPVKLGVQLVGKASSTRPTPTSRCSCSRRPGRSALP